MTVARIPPRTHDRLRVWPQAGTRARRPCEIANPPATEADASLPRIVASENAQPAASAENNERRRLPTPRSTAVRDPQIPIGALDKQSPNLPAVSSLGGFRAPAPGAVPPSQRAGARNPRMRARMSSAKSCAKYRSR